MIPAPTNCPVLVVDDDAMIRRFLADLLNDEGYPVETASNGREALTHLHSGFRPCLILLDWKMPVMNGAQFRLEQHTNPDLATIPVAVISAHVPYDATEQVDADIVIPKPVNLNLLLETVAQYCGTGGTASP